jgi:elongation factor P--(R)-beta-lysine ligase
VTAAGVAEATLGHGASWRPTASWHDLRLRARLLAGARDFFQQRDVTEVETPALVSAPVSDPQIANIAIAAEAQSPTAYLHTSPEYHMKRLLAAGAPDIYQIAKVFRQGETGGRHHPEFTMVEWYRFGFDLGRMAAETCDLVRHLAALAERPLAAPEWLDYATSFHATVGVDALTATGSELRTVAMRLLSGQLTDSLVDSLGAAPQGWLDLLASHVMIPALAQHEFFVLSRYPLCQAALARRSPDNPATAERFEVFWHGVELANGYHELCDPGEQRQRFANDASERARLGLPTVSADHRLLAALDAGLPDCAGVAMGFDRVVMLALGHRRIDDVVSFRPAEE